MRKVLLAMLCTCLFIACGGNVGKEGDKAQKERDLAARQQLQGVWIDDNTRLPMLRIKDDSIFFVNQAGAPVCFNISGDTLIAQGAEVVAYRICKIEDDVFQFYTSLGDLVSLHKSDIDTIPFTYQPALGPKKEVIEKDSVFMYQGSRYRGYAYINPSTKKVFHPVMTDEGMIVDNIYYDNIIHICVYQGKKRLYAKDIRKEMFEGTVPDDFLQMAILSDMNFMGVDAEGFHYQATVSMPDDLSCYYVNLLIDNDSNLSFKLKE